MPDGASTLFGGPLGSQFVNIRGYTSLGTNSDYSILSRSKAVTLDRQNLRRVNPIATSKSRQ